VVATGSSALRVGSGSRESLAGRFERVTLTHWSAAAFMHTFDLSPAATASLVVRFGSYPGAFQFQHDLARWGAYIRDAIIEPAIGRDVLALVRQAEAWRFLWGESPHRVRSNQPLVPSVAYVEEVSHTERSM